MTFLTPREQRTLAAICDTLIPALEPAHPDENAALLRLSATASGLPALLETALERLSDDSQRRELKLVLGMLENGVVTGLLSGTWQPFSQMPLEARTALLYGWAVSRVEALRKAFNTFKRLGLFLFYSAMADDQPNPAWEIFGYRLPPSHHDSNGKRPIQPLSITGDTTLTADVLIVGSGAGGGVMAGELTAAGLDVIVVEKGEYFADSDFTGRELDGNERMYEKYGALTTADLSMPILAGSVLGGGTTINWSGSLRPPEYVLQEWERQYGFDGAAGADFQRSLDAVSARMNVNTDECAANRNNAMHELGAQKLGYKVITIPRNVKGCEDCGFCNFGCAFGAKQGTLKTYLQDAYDRGARIVVQAHVDRIDHSGGVVSGATLTARGADGTPRRVTVKAKAVIVSAGSLHTPAILLRSGLTHPMIGRNLRLHPATVTSGLFADPIRVWEGAPMARLTIEFANLDGAGYGVRLMNAPAHPGIYALAIAWENGRQHKRVMQDMAYLANMVIVTRDKHGGRVTVDKRGQPVIHYKIHPDDAKHAMRGIVEALRVHVAAGAKEVTAPQNVRPVFRPGADGDFESYLRRVQALGLQPNNFALFSAHQMASCRISGDAAMGAVKPDGETREVRNLFVADASAMPTCSGVNPMLTILGMTHFLAQRVKAKLI